LKVLLTSPQRSLYTGDAIASPIQGLLALAASLKHGTFFPEGFAVDEVRVVDEQLEYLKNPNFPQGFNNTDFKPDVIGIQALTSNMSNAVSLGWFLKARNPSALVVFGGIAPTQESKYLLQLGVADLIVHGEGEVTFSEVLVDFAKDGLKDKSKIKGISYLNADGVYTRNVARMNIPDINILPLPARELVDIDFYKKVSPGRVGNLITSRGCSFVCKYCFSKHQWGVGMRRYTIERAIQEISVMYHVYGIDRIRIEDDDFMESPNYVEAFCHELIKTGLHTKLEWEAKGRPNFMKEPLLRLLRKAGCFRLMMGVETLNPKLLKSLNRGATVESIGKALDALSNSGISVQATVILGIPGDTIDSMKYTLDYLNRRSRRRDIIGACFFTPFTSVEEDLKVMDYELVIKDKDYFSGYMPLTSSKSCSYTELWDLFLEMGHSRVGKYDRIGHFTDSKKVRNKIIV
jgi:radical SAM superfamily enzyme YgiQ (UPF0313 family)